MQLRKERLKLNRQWRQEGNRTLFAEAMAFVKKQQGSNPVSLLHTGDAFFITEVDMKQDIQFSQEIAEHAMEKVADEMGLATDQEILDIEKLIQHQPTMVPMLFEEIERQEIQIRDEESTSDLDSKSSLPSAIASDKEAFATTDPTRTDSLREKEAIVQTLVNGNTSYTMPLKSAIQ